MPAATESKTSFIVFAIRDFRTGDVIEDEVVQTGEDRFKSVKFRHTYYKAAELFPNETAAFACFMERKISSNQLN